MPLLKKPSLATMVLIGVALGIACGVFFGELMSPLHPVGMAFIRLLQMSVVPYIVVSLIVGIGRLGYREAGKLGKTAGALMLIMWAVALTAVLMFPLAFPEWERAEFFSTSALEEPQPFDLVAAYVPSNPFNAMANTIVPAIVVFSVALGIALIGLPGKEPLIRALGTLGSALSRISMFVVRLAPVGVFAIVGSAAGTMKVAELLDLQVYLVTYLLVWAIMTFWVLPGLVSSFSPLSYREVMGTARDALVTAFATGSLMVVLPILAEKSREILALHDIDGDDVDSAVDVLVPTSMSFPSTGMVLSLGFVLFGGWLASTPIPVLKYPLFAILGLVSFCASPTISLPFLFDTFRLPSDLFQLYLVTDVFVSRFGTLTAAVHVLALTLLASVVITGRLRFNGKTVLRYASVSVTLLIAAVLGARLFLTHVSTHEYRSYQLFVEMRLADPNDNVTVHPSPPPSEPEAPAGAMQRIRQRGAIRVGFFQDALPHAFMNSFSELVGFDVEMAHRLASDLGVGLEFVRINETEVAERLDKRDVDIVMSGLAVTTDMSMATALSAPYSIETVAFIVPDERRREFGDAAKVAAMRDLRVGVPNATYYLRWLRQRLPGATVVALDTPRDYFSSAHGALDALVLTAESGSAWTLVYPRFSVAIPGPEPIRIPLAYAMRKGDVEFVSFINTWVELKKLDGTVTESFERWILGRAAESREPRWSIVRDVLHWVDEPQGASR